MATTSQGLQQVGVQAVVLDAAQFATLSKQIEQQIDGMNAASKKLANEGSSSFQKFSDVGTKALLGLTTALTAAFLAAQLLGGVNFLGAAASIEQGLAVVQSAAQGTTEDLAKLKDLSRDLTTTTVASYNDILEASAELARGGISVLQQYEGALKAVINLSAAAAGELPFDKAARAIASGISIFNLGAESANKVGDAIIVASQKSSASVNDVLRSFAQVAPIAPLLNISLAETAATIGVLGKAGLRGSDAGTSLKQMYIQLLAPTKKAAEMMDKYNISLFDAAGKTRPLGDLLLDLRDNFGEVAIAQGKITEAARANALAVIFGSDAIRAAALIAINGADDFFEFKDAMEQGTFTAQQLADIIQAPLQSQLKILQNNAVALSTDIGNGLIPVIRALVVELIKAAQAAAPFTKAIGDALNFAFTGTGFDALRDKLSDIFGSQIAASILSFVTSVQAAIVEVSSSLTSLITKIQSFSGSENAVNSTSDAFYNMANAIATAAAVASGIISVFGDLIQLAGENEEAFSRLRTILLSVVAGSVIAAFVGLIGVLVSLAATFSAILLPMLAIGVAGGVIVGVLSALSGQSAETASAINTLEREADQAADAILDLQADIDNSPLLVQPDMDLTSVAGGENALLESVEDVINEINENAVIVPTIDTQQTASDFDHFFSQVSLIVRSVRTVFNELSSTLVSLVNNTVASWRNDFIGFLNFVAGWASGIAQIISSTFNVLGAQVTEFFNGLASGAAAISSSLQSGIVDFRAPQLDTSGLDNAIDSARASLSGLGDGADNVRRSITAAQDRISLLRVELPNRFTPAVGGASNALRALGDQADRTTGSMDGFGGGADKAKKAAKEAGPAIDGFTDALAKAIRLQGFIDEFGDVGAKAIDSLVDAVVSNIDKDGAKAAEALHKFKQLLRTELVPDFQELGYEADAAFAQALIDRSDEAVEAAKDVVRRMAEAAKAQGALTLDTFRSAFDLGSINNQLGSQGAKLMVDLKKAIVEGGTDVVRAVGTTASDIVQSFAKDLSPDQARDFTQRFMAAISAAIRAGTPEALTDFQNFSKQLNFDKEIAKAQNALNKAISAATKTYTESLDDIGGKQQDALSKLSLEKFFKDQADSEKEMLREIVDGHIDGLKRIQDNERRVRKENREDLRQQLDDERNADDLRLRRSEELADAIKARRKRLEEKLKGDAPSKDMQAQGRAIQGNSVSKEEDEVKALEERWRKEDERAALLLQRRQTDKATQRQDQSDDQLFELNLIAEFERQKKVLEAPIRAAERIAKEKEHNTAINNIVLQNNEQIAQLNRTTAQTIINAQIVFDDTKEKLTLEQELASTVFDEMLTDAQAVTAELEKQRVLLQQMGTLGKSSGIPGDDAVPALGLQTVSSGGPQGPNPDGSWGQQVTLSGDRAMVSSLSSSGGVGAVPGYANLNKTTNQDILAAAMRPLSSVDSRERSSRPLNSGSTVTNNVTYQVNSSYSQMQSDADVRLDMQALVALTS